MRCAGIVTYNPDLDRLRANLNNTVSQVDAVFIFDNGSNNVDAMIQMTTSDFKHIYVQKESKNRGIAYGLNQLLINAKQHSYNHILLLDQDSVPSIGMCDELERYLQGKVALVCPFILDRNRMTVEEWESLNLPSTEQLTHAAKYGAITSGSMLDVPAAFAVGGFDNDLFIDFVDFDFNERLLLNGYSIVRDNTVFLLHEKGKSEKTFVRILRRIASDSIRWQPLFKLGYSPERCYYQARNRIIFWKKYHRYTNSEGIIQLPSLIVLSFLFESGRIKKVRAYMRGIKDGMRMEIAEYNN